jgi:hypothetical protein
MRIHGTTGCRPAEEFRTGEAHLLLTLPGSPFDIPLWSDPKVHRDFHVAVANSLYSVHHSLVGQTLRARADSATVKLYSKGQLIKVHPRVEPRKRMTDEADFPTGKEIYANRDLNALQRQADKEGASIGIFTAALLDHPLPWTKMRQVYRLLGLVKKWGAERVDKACHKALEAEAIDVNLVSRMLDRARESAEVETTPSADVVQGRFARDPEEFSTGRTAR